ncbi:MAG: hypothetical protein HYT20_00725 [Candidatus Nealsonbacteria bacterium]|nr:hypothetical protein [Candidatus Nealsonbacteria bacterium]
MLKYKRMYNYQTICQNNLLKDLPAKHKEVIVRRFGLGGDEKETLESIGNDFSVTRERVRQIEEDGLKRLEDKICLPVFQNIFNDFSKYFKTSGSLRREDLALQDLGGQKFKNQVSFLLTIGKQFQKYGETQDFHAFWAVDHNALNVAQKLINDFTSQLESKKEPMALPKGLLSSYVEISKNILKGSQGLYGLKNWPEINPRGVKDKAYLAMKKEGKPVHFTKVADLIGKDALVQTVHNELIKDQRFVLVGRGLYALKEWGYEQGFVKDVIAKVINSAGGQLHKNAIVQEVLKQRQVKPSTVLLNLQNQKHFIKNSEDEYTIREA